MLEDTPLWDEILSEVGFITMNFCIFMRYFGTSIFCRNLIKSKEKIPWKLSNMLRYSEIILLSLLSTLHTVSFDWFLSSLEWILSFEFCLLKLLIFYQKLLRNIRSRLNSSTFWVFEPVFRYVWSKLKLCAQKMKILIKHI